MENANILDHLRKNYPLGSDISTHPLMKGEENRSFHVTAGGEQFVLRVYSTHHSTTGLRNREGIAFELDFMEHARALGVPAPKVVAAVDGSRITTIFVEDQLRFAALFEFAQGEEATEYSEQIARATAETLKNLRRASMSFPPASPRRWPGDIIQLSLLFYAANQNRIARHREPLDRLFADASTGYELIQSLPLPSGIIHGDVKVGNLLFDSGQVTAVIDFDDYRETYLLEEFIRAVLHDLDSPTRNAIRSGHFATFREALAADPTVTPEEMEHLGTFLKARFVYDLAAYAAGGLHELVDEVIADRSVREVIGY